MSTRKLIVIAAVTVAFVMLIIAGSVLISHLSGDDHEIRLPEAGDAAGDGDEVLPGTDDGLERVEVNESTVQAVIAALSRPSAYTRSLSAELFWEGGSADYSIEAYVSGTVSRYTVLDDYDAKHIVVTPDKTYMWYDSSSRVYSGDAASVMGDEYQMLVTYEDIIHLPENAISDAGYVEFEGKNCIFAEYVSGRLNYTTKCYVSSETGLVAAAEVYDGDTIVYSMREISFAEGEPDQAAFLLPDGTSAFTAP